MGVFSCPFAYITGPVLGFGLAGVWVINILYRSGQAMHALNNGLAGIGRALSSDLPATPKAYTLLQLIKNIPPGSTE